MIRFKKTTAPTVPTPPAGYATLFVDDATGLPAAKDSTGTVISLKGADGADGTDGANGADGTNGADGADGAGLPTGGTPGQVVTMTAGGPAWGDAPSGSDGGTWVSMLAPAGVLRDMYGTTVTGAMAGDIPGDETVLADGVLEGVRADLADQYADRVRLTLTVTVDDFNNSGAGGGT